MNYERIRSVVFGFVLGSMTLALAVYAQQPPNNPYQSGSNAWIERQIEQNRVDQQLQIIKGQNQQRNPC